MRNNRGTTFMPLPIHFHIGSYKLNWKIVRDEDIVMFVGSALTGRGPSEFIPINDGWELVRQFLSVKTGDEHGILSFLLAHGRFRAPRGSQTSKDVEVEKVPGELVLETISLQEFAAIQDYVRRTLLNGNPTLPTPWEAKDIQKYEVAFAGTRSGTQAHVRVYETFPSIFATVQFKLAQGARFRRCYRKDCRLPFEVTSRHPRRFCTQYCAHITSLRQRRKAERSKKRGTRVNENDKLTNRRAQ
jgi:hypothetical protein